MGWNDDRRMRKNCIAVADGRSGAAVPLRGSDAYHSHALHYFSVAYEATVREEGVQRCMQLRDLHLFFSPCRMWPHFSEGATGSLYSPVVEEADQPRWEPLHVGGSRGWRCPAASIPRCSLVVQRDRIREEAQRWPCSCIGLQYVEG
jgi:hypothetical protein